MAIERNGKLNVVVDLSHLICIIISENEALFIKTGLNFPSLHLKILLVSLDGGFCGDEMTFRFADINRVRAI